VPKDRPPPKRLYLITQGVALYKGEQMTIGESWGAEDVLLLDRKKERRLRAFAMTYLHVQHLDGSVLHGLKDEFPRAHRLCRLWTMMHAVGEFLVENLRKTRARPVLLPSTDLEGKINMRQLRVEATGEKNKEGNDLYRVVNPHVVTKGQHIVKTRAKAGEEERFHVLGAGPQQAMLMDGRSLVGGVEAMMLSA